LELTDSQKSNDELQAILGDLWYHLDVVAGYEARIARFESPRFNVFDYIEPDENKVAAIIANLLDPNGSHGQGGVFLHSFVERIGFEAATKKVIVDAVVQTEDRTNWNRRLDLTLTGDTWVLGLENKIDAAEQPNQITDYMAHLRTIAGENWFFVFLTRSGDNPKGCQRTEWQKERDGRRVLACRL